MKLKLYQADAFTSKLFGGNPAAVCPLDKWLPDAVMQNIAMENNLAETAFIVAYSPAPVHKGGEQQPHFHIRWFTPAAEVDLCGHATLATAHILFEHLNFQGTEIAFNSRSGILKVRKDKNELTLDFPADIPEKVNIPDFLEDAFHISPLETYKGTMDYMLVFKDQKEIESLAPKMDLIAKAESRGAIVTAPGQDSDFVSRYFAPQFGIPEDPVTGSAHTVLTPYWSKRLGKKELSAIQLSKRKGHLKCKDLGARVEITGQAKTYMIGEIEID